MFGFRKSITNDECEIVAIKGLLNGLNNHYINLVKISKDPNYRGDLTEEIERVKTEIKINNQKLVSYGK
jgi:hypothetical protein